MNITYATEILGKKPSRKVWNHIPTLRYRYVYWKSMCQDKESLLQTTTGEHRFQLLQCQNLIEGLKELDKVTNDQLGKKMISNLLDKHEINKLIHIRDLFPNPQGLHGSNT